MHWVKSRLAAKDVILQHIQTPSEFVSSVAESWREKEINQSCYLYSKSNVRDQHKSLKIDWICLKANGFC